jgi:hypothetical protein
MQSFQFYMFNPPVLVNPPDNWQELQLELMFDNDSPDAVINATKLVWKGAEAALINKWVSQGLSGGLGIFEGIPLQIAVGTTNQELVFDGIMDLTDPETYYTCDIITTRIRDKRIDMVSQLMDSISFCYLATPVAQGGAGIINPSPRNPNGSGGDYLTIAYQRNNLPNYVEALTVSLAIIQIVDKMETAIYEIIDLTADVIDAATTIWLFPMLFFYAVLKAMLYGIYVGIICNVCYLLIINLFDSLVSPVLTKFGMYANDLMQRACTFFGLQYQSSILQTAPYNQLVIMPSKSSWVSNENFTQTIMNQFLPLYNGQMGGVDNNAMEHDDLYNWQHNQSGNTLAAYGYYDGTPGDFIRTMEQVFNAKAKIIINSNGQPVLHFERWDYQYQLANYSLPPISDQTPFNRRGLFNSTGFSESKFSTNASELASNYEIRYAMDSNDFNTYDYYEGTSCMCTTRPITLNLPNNGRNCTLMNLKQVNFDFAQAKRKDNKTRMEKIFPYVYNIMVFFYDTCAIGLVPATLGTSLLYLRPIPFSIPPCGFTGHLLLSDNNTSVPKMFIGAGFQQYPSRAVGDWGGRGGFNGLTVHPNNKDIIGAKALMKNFHFSNLPLTTAPSNGTNSWDLGYQYSTPYAPGSTYYNQYLIYKSQRVSLCLTEYDLIKNNNVITTVGGLKGRVQSVKWNPFRGHADIDYRVQMQYTKNLKTTFVIDGITTQTTL